MTSALLPALKIARLASTLPLYTDAIVVMIVGFFERCIEVVLIVGLYVFIILKTHAKKPSEELPFTYNGHNTVSSYN